MDNNEIMFFLQKYWYFITLAMGILILIGAIKNWNWLCDPIGAPDSHRYGRGTRRVILFLLGIVLIIVSIWSFVLMIK